MTERLINEHLKWLNALWTPKFFFMLKMYLRNIAQDACNLAQDAHDLAQDACNLVQDARNLAGMHAT